MDIEKIRQYWEEKAEEYRTQPQATTSDFWLREIEIKYLEKEIRNIPEGSNILDIGCGNGYSTIALVKRLKNYSFTGIDYSEKMIQQANEARNDLPDDIKQRVSFYKDDVTKLIGKYDGVNLVITDRCLINLPTLDLQEKAISRIAAILEKGGTYLAIENFIEGHDNFNRLRKSIGLKEIPVRWHNLFFNQDSFKAAVSKYFNISEIKNISSLYYLATRVIYSKICALENREPDYEHIIYQVAAELPIEGDYGPVKLAILKRK